MKFNLLYVDDEEINLSGFKLLFRKGFNIVTASSGKKGLEILKDQPIHIIVTDQRMPDMNGLDFLKKVKDKWPNIKCIILTAYDDLDVLKESINKIGIFWYVNKPFDPEQMEQVITNAENTYLAEKKLKESEEKFRGVFNSISDVFTRTDMEGKCVLVSPSIYNLIGYKPEEIIGRNLADFYADPKQRIEVVEILKKSKSVVNFELEFIRKDGKKITVSTNAKIYFGGQGEPLGVEGNIRDITEQKKSEDALKKSEKRFKDVAENALEWIWEVDSKGKYTYASPVVERIVGYKPEEILQKHFYDLFYPDDKEELKRTAFEVFGRKEVFQEFINRNVHKNGEVVWLSTSGLPVIDENGELIGYRGADTDITKRRRAEKDKVKLLHEIGERLKELDCMYVISNSISTRETLEEIFQDIVDAIPPGWHYPEITRGKLHYNDREWVSEPFEDTAWKQSSDIIINGQKLGVVEVYYLEERPILDEGPFMKEERNLINSIAQTISEAIVRKQAEEKLQENEEKFRTLVTKTEEIIFIIAKDGTFLLSEGKGLDKLGLKPGEVVGKSVFDLYKDSPLMLDKMGQAFNGETVIMDHEIGDVYFKSWYTPHLNQKGEIIGLLGLAVNITEQKEAEIQILENQAVLKSLTNELIISEEKQRREIANDLHDDVGQILASSRLLIAAIKETMGIKDIIKKLNDISSGLYKAIGSTRNIIFELSPPQLNEMGLVAALSGWMHEEMTQYDIKYEFTGDTSKLPISNEVRYLLFRCIRELLLNVIKHAGATNVIVSFEKKKNIISISVHDNGSGYNYNPHLPRTKDTGFGLLSINERIESIDGELLIDTAPGKGTNATLRLPIKKMKK